MNQLKELKQRPSIADDNKLSKTIVQFEQLLSELDKRALSEKVINFINDDIEEINELADAGKELRKLIRKRQRGIINHVEKELKLVPKYHYRNTWMIMGMSTFGIGIGVAFGASLGNMAFIGAGMPIGMVIGMAIGSGMDKKALNEGRQLDVEIKY